MKIEAGKYYKTRDGRKVGPIQRAGSGKVHHYWHDGASFLGQFTNNWSRKGYSSSYPGLDIISEWQDEPSPIRTVTRKEIVPGVYGAVVIGENKSVLVPQRIYTSDKLREAAHILNQIAEALEDD